MPSNSNLFNCPACGHEVSRKARACPNCGHPFVKTHGVFYYVTAVIGSLLLLSVITGVVWVILIEVPKAQIARVRAQSDMCGNNLKMLGLSAKTWALDHGDRYPWNVPKAEGGSLESCKRGADGYDENIIEHLLVMTNEIGSPHILVCPSDSRPRAETWQALQLTNISYKLCTGPEVNDQTPASVMAVCPIHHQVLLADGSVQWVSSANLRAMTNNPAQAAESPITKSPAPKIEPTDTIKDASVEAPKSKPDLDVDAVFKIMRGVVQHRWTFKQGRSFTGYFVSVDAANVVVKDASGKLYSLPSNSLVDEDKQIADLILSAQAAEK